MSPINKWMNEYEKMNEILLISIFIFQYALIHQSVARTTKGIKTYILLPLFYILLPLFLLQSAYCEGQCVTLRPQKLRSKLCALRREITFWNFKLCELHVRLEDKFVVTRALVEYEKNIARLCPISKDAEALYFSVFHSRLCDNL